MEELQVKYKKTVTIPQLLNTFYSIHPRGRAMSPYLNWRLCVKHLEPNLADLQGRSTSGQTAATNESLRTS